jgi:hypothetical protein
MDYLTDTSPVIAFVRSFGEGVPYGMKSMRFPPETMSETSGLGLREEVTAELRSMIS